MAILRPLIEMAKHARQIAWLLTEMRCDYEDVELDCLQLVCRFSEELGNPPIEQMEDCIPRLVEYFLGYNESGFGVDSVSALNNILVKGTEKHKAIIIKAGAIRSFCELLRAAEDCIIIDAVAALSTIVEDD